MEDLGHWIGNRGVLMVFGLRFTVVGKNQPRSAWCFLPVLDIGLGIRLPLDDSSAIEEAEACPDGLNINRLSRTKGDEEISLVFNSPRTLAAPCRHAGCEKQRPAVMPSRACSLKAKSVCPWRRPSRHTGETKRKS